MTPPAGFLRSIATGVLAAAAGTAAMDAAQFARYRRSGEGKQSFWAWETSAGLDSWDDAPAPALVGRRAVELLTRRPLPPSRARLVNNVMHWAYGSGCGAALGVGAPRLRVPTVLLGPLFGAAVWTSSYVVLGALGLYKPIWTYPPEVLARDLGNHLVYGGATGLSLAALSHA